MNILITGGAGYIGSLLCQRLSEDHHVTTVDNLRYNQWHLVYEALQDCSFIKNDVRKLSPEFIQRFDIIIPLAAIVGAPACEKEPEEATSINLGNIEYMCEYANDDQLIILPNTNSGYGRVLDKICTEETPLNSISLYGQLKDRGEQAIMQRKNSIAFRLATVFGLSSRSRLDLLVNTLTRDAVRNKKISLFDGDFHRNYIHVYDVVRAFEFAIDNKDGMVGEVYNVGNDEINMTKMELAKKVQEICPCDLEVIKMTDPDQRDYVVSSKKMYEAGFKPLSSLEYGIREVKNYVEHLDITQERYMRNINAD